jgi:hypothetical protein
MASQPFMKCRTLIRVGMGFVLIVLLGSAAYAVWYIWASRQNPKVIEIVGGSILITLLLGSSSTLFTKIREKPKRHRASVIMWFLTSASLLVVLIAFLVYASNTPKDIKRQIPVTYLIDMNELEITSDLEIASSEARFVYRDAVNLFHNFKHASADNEAQVKNALVHHEFLFGTRLFRDLTEILIPRCIAGPPEQGEMEPALWCGELHRWQAWPHKSISCAEMDFNDIQGGFNQNQFFRIRGWPGLVFCRKKLRLPNDTRVQLLTGDSGWSSVYVIANDFVEIKIGIQVFVIGMWISPTFPAESAFRVSLAPGGKRRGPFCRVDTMIYYDVTFSRCWYSFPEMRHYEEWVNDLYALLERRFAWGSPQLLSFAEVMKRYEWSIEQDRK